MKMDIITNNAQKQGAINPNDEFYTPEYAIEPLIKYIKKDSVIWCPFDIDKSNFVKMLSKEHTVINTHLESGVDFFDYEVPICDYIISNPPYSLKYEIFQRLFSIGIPFAMLVGVVGIFESQKRFTLFSENDFETMYFDKRVSYFKDYEDVKPKLNPPFSSIYVTKDILPSKIVFERIVKK